MHSQRNKGVKKRIRSNQNTRFNACLKLQGGKDMFGNDYGESVISGNNDVQVRFGGVNYFMFKLFNRIEVMYYTDSNDIGSIAIDGNNISVESPEFDRVSQSVYNIVDQQIKLDR